MIKLPVKDRETIPWMTPREIPAIKAVLSAWRKLRRDRSTVANIRDLVSLYESPENYAEIIGETLAWNLEKLAAIDERLRKEARDGQA